MVCIYIGLFLGLCNVIFIGGFQVNFYNELSNKAKKKYLELWEPKIGQIVIFAGDENVIYYSDVEDLIDIIDANAISITRIKSELIPKASLELCFDMLEKIGYNADVIWNEKDKYTCELWYECEEYALDSVGFVAKNRLESLQVALKWALEKEVSDA